MKRLKIAASYAMEKTKNHVETIRFTLFDSGMVVTRQNDYDANPSSSRRNPKKRRTLLRDVKIEIGYLNDLSKLVGPNVISAHTTVVAPQVNPNDPGPSVQPVGPDPPTRCTTPDVPPGFQPKQQQQPGDVLARLVTHSERLEKKLDQLDKKVDTILPLLEAGMGLIKAVSPLIEGTFIMVKGVKKE